MAYKSPKLGKKSLKVGEIIRINFRKNTCHILKLIEYFHFENNLTKLLKMCIIKIGNKHTECMLSLYSKQHYIAVPKQNVVLFYLFLIISPKYVYNC